MCPTLCDRIDGSPPGSVVPGQSIGLGCYCLLCLLKHSTVSLFTSAARARSQNGRLALLILKAEIVIFVYKLSPRPVTVLFSSFSLGLDFHFISMSQILSGRGEKAHNQTKDLFQKERNSVYVSFLGTLPSGTQQFHTLHGINATPVAFYSIRSDPSNPNPHRSGCFRCHP